MASKKRDKLEIIRDMLLIVNREKGVGPTRLLHYSNLSPKMFKEYVSLLAKKNMIEISYKNKKKIFVMSNNGFAFLSEYKTIENIIANFGL